MALLAAEELKKMDPEPSMGWEVEKTLQAGREELSWIQPWGKDEKAQEASLLCTSTAAETTNPTFLPGGIVSPAAL